MKILVLGAGVIGTTTAYYLARAGASVTVVERQPGVALETSFANAGQVSPGYSTPWPAPGIPAKALKWMFSRHAPLSFRPDGSLWQLQWLAQLWRNCTADRYAVNKARMVRLAEYSRDCLQALRAETGIDYEQRCGGTLQLFRTAQQLAHARRDIAVLEQCGVAHRLLAGDQVFSVEPALAHARVPLTGGLHLPGDETGDCYLFTQRLAERARQLGVAFRFDAAVDALLVAPGNRIAGVRTGSDRLTADHYVVACGSYTRALLAPLGIDVPVYPVKGYSLTAPAGDETHALRSTVIDESYKVALTRFDARLRVGGMAELSGFDLQLDPRRRATLEKITGELLPATDLSAPLFWTGLRPLTPDGTPVIGATRWTNLSLNTGHGTLGWTMACGSAQLLADLLTGRPPAIGADDLGLSRYARSSAAMIS